VRFGRKRLATLVPIGPHLLVAVRRGHEQTEVLAAGTSSASSASTAHGRLRRSATPRRPSTASRTRVVVVTAAPASRPRPTSVDPAACGLLHPPRRITQRPENRRDSLRHPPPTRASSRWSGRQGRRNGRRYDRSAAVASTSLRRGVLELIALGETVEPAAQSCPPLAERARGRAEHRIGSSTRCQLGSPRPSQPARAPRAARSESGVSPRRPAGHVTGRAWRAAATAASVGEDALAHRPLLSGIGSTRAGGTSPCRGRLDLSASQTEPDCGHETNRRAAMAARRGRDRGRVFDGHEGVRRAHAVSPRICSVFRSGRSERSRRPRRPGMPMPPNRR
jgi:hypothetical protein